ncbi:MAG: transglutaminase-like domain-containing protein [Candidatus Binatia bacterium]
MTDDPIRAAYDEWTRGRDPVAARVALYERVRDLPFRYPSGRSAGEVLAQGGGSCSGKHALLAALFRHAGLPVRHMLCTHRFNDWPMAFPDDLQALLQKNEIVDVHDYLQVCIDGAWVDVDATWPLALREFGLTSEEWDGRSSMVLSVVSDEHEELDSEPGKAKEERLSKLTPRQRMLRKQFLERLSQWANELLAEAAQDR